MLRTINTKQPIGFAFAAQAFSLAASLGFSHGAEAAAIDDISVEVSGKTCEGLGQTAKSFIVYATNTNPIQPISVNFKYESVPAQQHFILFDSSLNPITDRFPKYHARRLAPREVAPIGCSYTYRAAPQPQGPLNVPVVITKQSAAYVDPNDPEVPGEDARSFAAFYLQGGINECVAGAKPPGLLYFLNLHPYARLSAVINLADDRGNRVAVVSAELAPLSALRAGCSNGFSRPLSITNAALETASTGAATIQSPTAPPHDAKAELPEQHREAQSGEATAMLAPLSLGTILQTQNVCAGSLPPGWIKINDAWNPTVLRQPVQHYFQCLDDSAICGSAEGRNHSRLQRSGSLRVGDRRDGVEPNRVRTSEQQTKQRHGDQAIRRLNRSRSSTRLMRWCEARRTKCR